MFTFLRRAVATLLVTGGLLLAFTGALLGADDYTMPAALMLVLTGGAVLLIRPHARPVPPMRRAARPDAWVAPAVVAPRPAPHCAVPAPRASPETVLPGARTSAGAAGAWHAPRTGGARHGVRHCVLPRGVVPHQRRASDGS